MCDQEMLRSACIHMQFDQSLCLSLEYSMTVKLLTEQHLEFLSLKRVCTDSSEHIHAKIQHCLKSHVAAHFFYSILIFFSNSNLLVFSFINPFHFGYLQTGTLANSEDPDEMLHNATFYQGQPVC